MIPIVTPAQMGEVDTAAPEAVEVLIGRAGAAVARAAVDLLGGAYGRRVTVVAGKGNNGADGREAARRLRRLGIRVGVIDAAADHRAVPACDLVIDAAYGTGFRGVWRPPHPRGAPVLAVDIPSGVDGCTGVIEGEVLAAVATVTFAALKPGLMLGRGREVAGAVELADIGLDAGTVARAHLVTDDDVAAWLPERPLDSHKWRAAVWVVAGSPGMTGAATLTTRGAQRAGAGYVRLSTPGGVPGEGSPLEAVGVPLPGRGWAGEVLDGLDRFGGVVVGPGLGRDDAVSAEVRRLVTDSPVPVVVDGDGLVALGPRPVGLTATTVLTPHDGEYARLVGHPPGPDRLEVARRLAADTGATVLLKGPTTVVAEPGGDVLVSASGGPQLATAGTGDVLSGILAALLATGLDPLRATATAAHVHGRAASLGWPRGLVAGDLVDLLPAVLPPPRPQPAPSSPR
ncbi:MAG: NAD(P)H-hydrate dehydratase [Actinobacteria bacterium]|nr:NAD(P)H-hydrate dehydratase [Actinomycetota bacterium]